jgi:imidazolonepropionase-like amidohydrolase
MLVSFCMGGAVDRRRRRREGPGTVEPGKAADLIVVAGNPADEIGATANVRLVMQAGRVIELAAD